VRIAMSKLMLRAGRVDVRCGVADNRTGPVPVRRPHFSSVSNKEPSVKLVLPSHKATQPYGHFDDVNYTYLQKTGY
jgi:hypothetical protein